MACRPDSQPWCQARHLAGPLRHRPGTEVHRNHPDWLVHHSDGRLRQIAPGRVEGPTEPEQQNPKLYALDISHPGAADWLRKLFTTVATDWGYDFIKIDFVE